MVVTMVGITAPNLYLGLEEGVGKGGIEEGDAR